MPTAASASSASTRWRRSTRAGRSCAPRADQAPKARRELADLALTANFERVDLSAHGFFAIDTKRCGFDWNIRPGTKADGAARRRAAAFNYFTQGVGCVEVEIDVLTATTRSSGRTSS